MNSRPRSGVFRYIRHDDMIAALANGWQYAADLGEQHGQYSCLMWWCYGDCLDEEVPQFSSAKSI